MGHRSSPKDSKVAVACIRVSTDKAKQALGVAGQRAAIEAWAAREGIAVAAWHVDEVSGAAPIDKRPGLLAALADLDVHHAELLVFQKIDRFTRDATAAALVGLELKRRGARVVFADGNGSGDDPTAQLLRSILVAVAQFERALIAARIKSALAVKRSRGEMTGAPRFGFRLADDGRRVEHDDNEQRVLARVRGLHEKGCSIRGICERLARDGVRGRAGRPLTRTAIHNIVRRFDADEPSPAPAAHEET